MERKLRGNPRWSFFFIRSFSLSLYRPLVVRQQTRSRRKTDPLTGAISSLLHFRNRLRRIFRLLAPFLDGHRRVPTSNYSKAFAKGIDFARHFSQNEIDIASYVARRRCLNTTYQAFDIVVSRCVTKDRFCAFYRTNRRVLLFYRERELWGAALFRLIERAFRRTRKSSARYKRFTVVRKF